MMDYEDAKAEIPKLIKLDDEIGSTLSYADFSENKNDFYGNVHKALETARRLVKELANLHHGGDT